MMVSTLHPYMRRQTFDVDMGWNEKTDAKTCSPVWSTDSWIGRLVMFTPFAANATG